MWRIVIPLIVGIAAAETVDGGLTPTVTATLLLLSLVASVATYIPLRRRGVAGGHATLFHLALMAFFLASGMCLHQLHTPRYTLPEGRQTVRLLLRDTPQRTTRRLRTTAEVLYIRSDSSWHKASGRLMLFLLPDSAAATLEAGDVIETRLFVRKTETTPPYYAKHLRHKKILYVGAVGRNPYTVVGHRRLLASAAQRRQQLLAQRLDNERLTPHHRSAARAFLLGQRDFSYAEQRQQYATGGIVHLLCVSGLHVGIVAYLVTLLLKPLGNRRRGRLLRGVLQMLALWGYVLITGMAPSTVRAGIMLSLYIVAHMTGRDGNGLSTLALAAFLMLVANPMLLFDIGFQFSYVAMTAIFLLALPLASLVREPQEDGPAATVRAAGKALWDLLCITLSTQLFVLPLQLLYFQRLPTYFLFTNLLIVPFAALLLSTALVLLLVGGWTWAAGVAATLLDGELSVVDALLRRFASLPYAELVVAHFTPLTAVLAYVALLLLTLIVRSHLADSTKQQAA